jgi:tetratricopeptide (TPR) repeat protein
MKYRYLPLAASLLIAIAGGVLLAQDDGDDDAPKPAKKPDEPRKSGPDELPDEPLARAQALLARGRHDEATEIARSLVALDAKALAPRALLCEIYLKTGQDKDAARATEELTKLDRTYPEGHLLLGRYLEATGDLDQADAEYELGLGIADDLKSFEGKVRLAELRALRGKKAEATSLLKKVLEDYQARDDLRPMDFVWVARGCRLLDFYPDVKAEYAQKMTAYAKQMLDQALDKDPRCKEALVDYGQLYLDKGDTPAAQAAFEKAVKLDPNDPAARLGLARALVAASYKGSVRFGDAETELRKALAADPTLPGAHALLAELAVNDGDPDRALERCDGALKARPWAVELHAARGAALLMKGDEKGFAAEEQALLAKLPTCAAFYDEIARTISVKFRYAEARDLAKKALDLDAGYYPARATLGLNLLRTGDETEGKKQLEQAFKDDPFDVITFNSLELLGRLEKDYTTVEDDHFVVRLHKKEEGSKKIVLGLLEEARAKLTKKYGVTLQRKTLVELFPRVEDFSARSIGLPFIPALGVCFGDVMTVISANEKKTFGKHSWGRTAWHEFTHVCTLNRTHNRIPRWLTEGISVYEESRGRPSWVREYDVPILTLRARGLVLPMATFDEGFTKPRFADQVMMSYYQGGLTCEFIEQRWGFPKILELLDQYAAGKTTKEAIPAAFGLTLDQFDRKFLAFLEERYAGIAYVPPPTLDEKDALLDRVAEAPWDVGARGELARAYALLGKPGDAEAQAGEALRGVRTLRIPQAFLPLAEPDAGIPGALLRAEGRAAWLRAAAGDASLALGIVTARRDKSGEALRHLAAALELGTRDPVEAHRQRSNILQSEKRWDEAIEEAEAVVRLMPPIADMHRYLAGLKGAKGDPDGALAELETVCSLDSDDLKTRLEVAGELKKRERWPEVAKVLADAALIDPFVPGAHLLYADACRHTGQWEKGAVAYTAALDAGLATGQATAYAGRAECLAATGDLAAARADVKKALELDPDDEGAQKLKERLGEK